MRDGNLSRAERIFDTALRMARRKLRGAASEGEILGLAIEHDRPAARISHRRVGGKMYRVPIPISKKTGDRLRALSHLFWDDGQDRGVGGDQSGAYGVVLEISGQSVETLEAGSEKR